jgi:hypothetical protein
MDDIYTCFAALDHPLVSTRLHWEHVEFECQIEAGQLILEFGDNVGDNDKFVQGSQQKRYE